MKKPENEIVYDGPIGAVDQFTKEFDGIDQSLPNGLQEVWGSTLSEEVSNQNQAEDVKNKSNS